MKHISTAALSGVGRSPSFVLAVMPLLWIACSVRGSPPSAGSTPSDAARKFCSAVYYRDEAALNAVCQPTPGLSTLLREPAHTFGQGVRSISSAQYDVAREGQEFRMNGRLVSVPEALASGNTRLVLVDFGNPDSQLPVKVISMDGEWFVDAGPFINAVNAARAVDGP